MIQWSPRPRMTERRRSHPTGERWLEPPGGLAAWLAYSVAPMRSPLVRRRTGDGLPRKPGVEAVAQGAPRPGVHSRVDTMLEEEISVMHLRTATHLGLAVAAMVGVSSVFNLGAPPTSASSHREAPLISQDP